MANELVVVEAVREVSGAVNALVTAYRETHQINKAKQGDLKMRLDKYLKMEKSRAISEVSRVSIEEIAKTQTLIDRLELRGSSLALAVNMLEEQGRQLAKLLEGF